jgi:hypothetical protein
MKIISVGEDCLLIYDRENKVCIIMATTVTPLPDAVAIVRSMKVDIVWIIAPRGANEYEHSIATTDDFQLFWLK